MHRIKRDGGGGRGSFLLYSFFFFFLYLNRSGGAWVGAGNTIMKNHSSANWNPWNKLAVNDV